MMDTISRIKNCNNYTTIWRSCKDIGRKSCELSPTLSPITASLCQNCICSLDTSSHPNDLPPLVGSNKTKTPIYKGVHEWTWGDSNPWPPQCDWGALPTALQALVFEVQALYLMERGLSRRRLAGSRGKGCAFMRWSSTQKSGIFVLLHSQYDPDDRIEILKNEFLGCGQNDQPVQVVAIIKTNYLK